MVFYSGGFIYNSQTKKVFLQLRDNKTKNNPNLWTFFGGTNKVGEKPEDTFLREIDEELDIKIPSDLVKPLYHYFNPDYGIYRYVFYITTLQNLKFNLTEGKDAAWFDLNGVMKQSLSKRTIQDLIFFKKSVKSHKTNSRG